MCYAEDEQRIAKWNVRKKPDAQAELQRVLVVEQVLFLDKFGELGEQIDFRFFRVAADFIEL